MPSNPKVFIKTVAALILFVAMGFSQQPTRKSLPVRPKPVETAEHKHAREYLSALEALHDQFREEESARSGREVWIDANCYNRFPGGVAKPGISIKDQCKAICGDCTR